MIASANAAAPTVGDQAAVLNLHNAVKAMSAAVAELRTAAAKVSGSRSTSDLESEGWDEISFMEAVFWDQLHRSCVCCYYCFGNVLLWLINELVFANLISVQVILLKWFVEKKFFFLILKFISLETKARNRKQLCGENLSWF